jgi:hypothetical protein
VYSVRSVRDTLSFGCGHAALCLCGETSVDDLRLTKKASNNPFDIHGLKSYIQETGVVKCTTSDVNITTMRR